MTAILRAGVVGAGVFGGHHAARYAELAGVALAAVLDTHPDRARALAERHGGEAFDDLGAFLAAVDVVSVASPAVSHGRVALAALRAGKCVYVEKPIATTLEDADAIVAEAAGRGLVAACGFLERAAFQAIGLFDAPGPPIRLEAARLGPPSARNLDVSVVLDLMIHDLDLALALTAAAPLAVEAEGACIANRRLDTVEAEITFEDGFTARARASRAAQGRERTLRLIWPEGDLTIDFLANTFENTTPFAFDAGFAAVPAARDRLGTSLARFIAAVRGDAPAPMASAADGLRALDLALAVEQAVGG